MERDQNFAGIANSMEDSDGQALLLFMSNSPWSGQGVYEQIREEIKEKAEMNPCSVLILDEYADEKAGGKNAPVLNFILSLLLGLWFLEAIILIGRLSFC